VRGGDHRHPLALRRPYTFLVMALLILLATRLVLLKMSTDIFPEINIPVISSRGD
jgi:multidrug efflux pump subunit AcrB